MEVKLLNILLELVDSIDRDQPRMDKIRIIHSWLDEHTHTVTQKQSVIKTVFTSEEEDILKYHLATKLSEELMESCVYLETTPNQITTKIVSFKRLKP